MIISALVMEYALPNLSHQLKLPEDPLASPRQKAFYLGQQTAFLGVECEKARSLIRPWIQTESFEVFDGPSRRALYIQLWNAYWDGFNSIQEFEGETSRLV